jgi:hypothetical protein
MQTQLKKINERHHTFYNLHTFDRNLFIY